MEINPNFSERAKEDFALVLDAQQNKQPKAFEALLLRYKDPVFYLVLKMVHNRDDAEDLTIEVFGKIFNNIHSYNPKWAFSTWLYKSATNNAIDFIRKRRLETYSLIQPSRNADGEERDFSLKIPSNTLDPEEELIRKQRSIIMKELLDKLNVKYRTLIELRYYKEYSYEEIAEELKMPLGTVKAQLFRAKELLYSILKNNPLRS
jgi:RNA polymerase sigma-70 factor (ECF subfamily)